jgi:hypothetical protein
MKQVALVLCSAESFWLFSVPAKVSNAAAAAGVKAQRQLMLRSELVFPAAAFMPAKPVLFLTCLGPGFTFLFCSRVFASLFVFASSGHSPPLNSSHSTPLLTQHRSTLIKLSTYSGLSVVTPPHRHSAALSEVAASRAACAGSRLRRRRERSERRGGSSFRSHQ